MKKYIFVFGYIFLATFQLLSQESEFKVSLEKDSKENLVYLVFENLTSDSLIIFSTFERFDHNMIPPGFIIEFYYNEKQFFPEWEPSLSRIYEYEQGRTPLGPLQTVKFPVWLPYLGSNIEKIRVVAKLKYRYLNYTKRKFVGSLLVETNSVCL